MPPTSLIACNSARLLCVRLLPLLRRTSGSPVSARRRASCSANDAKSMRVPGQRSVSVQDFEVMIATCFFLYAPLKAFAYLETRTPSLRGAEGDAAIQGGSALSSPWRAVMALDCFVAALLAMTVNAGIGRIYFPSMCSR